MALASSNPGIAAAKTLIRDGYAWPGGYALFLVMADGGVLCRDCTRREFRSIVQYSLWHQPSSGWMPEGLDHTGNCDEAPVCDHCGREIN